MGYVRVEGSLHVIVSRQSQFQETLHTHTLASHLLTFDLFNFLSHRPDLFLARLTEKPRQFRFEVRLLCLANYWFIGSYGGY